MKKEIDAKFAISVLIILSVAAVGYIMSMGGTISFPWLPSISFPIPPFPPPTVLPSESLEIKQFSSEQEFKDYLEEGELGYIYGFGMTGMSRGMGIMEEAMPTAPADGVGAAMPKRVSETTVQVAGIDEPDIVKTDGKEIYFSSKSYYQIMFDMPEIMQAPEMMIYPPPQREGATKIIKAFPPADLSIHEEIDKTGDLLLYEDILVIFSGDEIYGYDVSNPSSPKKEWDMELGARENVLSARLYQGKIYLIVQTRVDTYRPCPIEPLSVKGDPLSIRCTDIYYPVITIPADVTYTAMVFDPESGKVEDTVSWVGTSSSSILYMSENAIYVTYSHYGDFIEFFYNFFNKECQDIVPFWVIEKLGKLMEYDISNVAKMTEFELIIQSYQDALDDDESLKIENELNNRMEDYYKEHKRDLEKTGIAKIDLSNLEISASGNVPGRPLNQFSLDEYKGYLRVATTIGEGWMFGAPGESANDVYVLDKNLRIVGYVADMGLEERIYSVRFVQDKGYVVTFREIDPFYVLDLSKPEKPELKGELKIPGYSSYLHPITKDKILGIGKENWKVKISLFDVRNPSSPDEIDKYILDDSWSDILNTHHAFLLDKKHEIFFLPGSRGGYVFSFQNDQLELIKAVSNISAKRALYINDYLYIIGDDKIAVLNEIDWEKVNELEL